MARYTFSGHESFSCKSLWLKKGYDFAKARNRFTNDDAVIKLGVGKNMVSSIRYWLKAFGLTENDEVQPLADFIFDDEKGVDPFMEETTTLWLLHYSLVKKGAASIYRLGFTEFQREKKEFDKAAFHAFLKKKCSVPEQRNVYNENTVKKDISVFLQNYVQADSTKASDDTTPLLQDLSLIYSTANDSYAFSETRSDMVPTAVMLYALKDYSGNETTLSFDVLKEVSLIFGLTASAMHEVLTKMANEYSKFVAYTDNSGIKNVQFLKPFNVTEILRSNYAL